MKVPVSIEETAVEGDHGRLVDGIRATCTRCGHDVECMGRSESAERYACARLRDDCPQHEHNFYFPEA